MPLKYVKGSENIQIYLNFEKHLNTFKLKKTFKYI